MSSTINAELLSQLNFDMIAVTVHYIASAIALLMIIFAIVRNYTQFGEHIGMNFVFMLFTVIVMIWIFPKAANAFFDAMITWRQDSKIGQNIADLMAFVSKLTLQSNPKEWLSGNVTKAIPAAVCYPLAQGMMIFWDALRAFGLLVCIIVWQLLMWLSPIFLSMMLVSELKTIWINYLMACFAIALMPIAFFIGDGICWWVFECLWYATGMEKAFITAGTANSGFTLTPDLLMRGAQYAAQNMKAGAGSLSLTLAGALRYAVCAIGVFAAALGSYVFLPKAFFELFRGGSMGNPISLANSAGSAAAGAGMSLAGAGRGAMAKHAAAKQAAGKAAQMNNIEKSLNSLAKASGGKGAGAAGSSAGAGK